MSSATPAWDLFRARALESGRTLAEQAQTHAPQAAGVLRSIGTTAFDAVERKVKQSVMPAAAPGALRLGLCATQLSELAYATSVSELEAGLARLDRRLQLVRFRLQPTKPARIDEAHMPQWFIARTSDGASVYVAFRGTDSSADVLRDLMAYPLQNGALRFHSGFLLGVRDDAELRDTLQSLLARSAAHVHLVGHSLGGSLALALPCITPPMLPASHSGDLTVVAVGSPPVIHGPLDGAPAAAPAPARAAAAGGGAASAASGDAVRVGEPVYIGDEAEHVAAARETAGRAVGGVPMGVPIGVPLGVVVPPGSSALPRDAVRCRALVVVNAADAVPRVLGSPLPLASRPFFVEVAKQAAMHERVQQALGESNGSATPSTPASRELAASAAETLLQTLPAYVHLPHAEVVLVRASGEALCVPPTERAHVLHLHESISLNFAHHHHVDEYVRSLQAAVRHAT